MRELTIQTETLNSSTRVGNVGFAIVGLVLISILVYWPATAALWHYWTDDIYVGGHGLLVAVLGAWLLYRSCGHLAGVTVQPSAWALIPLLACSLAALVFFRAGIHTLQLLTLPALIWLAVLAAFGTGVARAVAVPIGYLYFAMPAWNLLSVPLQGLTLWMVAALAPIVGLPATVSGSLVAFPNGARFIVTLACSGVGFLVQGLAVATLLGELENATLGRRLRLSGSMVLIALATNWTRVLLLLTIGYFGGMNNVIVSRHHLLFGYVLFVIVLIVFVWVAARPALSPPGADAASFAATARRSPLAAYLLAILGLSMVPLLATILRPSRQHHPSAASVLPPPERGDWRGPIEPPDSTWRPEFVGAHAQWHVAYEYSGGENVEALAIGYVTQESGRELVNTGNSLVGRGLAPVETALVDGGGRHYREIVAADTEGGRSVVWSIYVIGGRPFVTPVFAQLWYGLRSLGTPPYSVLFAFRARCVPSCAEARTALVRFVQGVGTELIAAAAHTPQPDRGAGPV